MVTNSGYSMIQGPHQVAQKLTSKSSSVSFFNKSLKPAGVSFSRVTSFAAQSLLVLMVYSFFQAHFIEQPNAGVCADSEGRDSPFKVASMALRKSSAFPVPGFSFASIRPE